MEVKLRLPDIKGSEVEQLKQIRSYLYQLIPQLQYALDNVSANSEGITATPKSLLPARNNGYAVSSLSEDDDTAQATFNSIKSLIIKSADIVEAYYEEINRRLESIYVAQSDFGDFAERTSQEIEETSTSTTQWFENIQVIIANQGGELASVNGRIDDTNGSVAGLGAGLNDANSKIAEVDQDLQDSKDVINESIQGVQERVTGVNALLEDAKAQLQGSIEDITVYLSELQNAIIGVSAYLKTGLLYTTDGGIPVYGLEIGQSVRDEVAGTEVFNKYARFTSEKLSFYDQNGTEVAYISDKKLFIKMAEITVSFKIGGLISLVMANGDVVEKWVGMGG